jgi:predicted nucleic acid-binding protein
VIAEHELLTAEAVISELRRVLQKKFRIETRTIDALEAFLRGFHVERLPSGLPQIALRDRADTIILASAAAARSEVFITGDAELLSLPRKTVAFEVVSPRQFWQSSRRR